jgi:hypothetical protein
MLFSQFHVGCYSVGRVGHQIGQSRRNGRDRAGWQVRGSWLPDAQMVPWRQAGQLFYCFILICILLPGISYRNKLNSNSCISIYIV